MHPDRDQAIKAVKERYEREASVDKYATSQDMNFREIEIEFLSKYLSDRLRILDIGCGNGYSIARFASTFNSEMIGVDFSENMIKSARELIKDFKLLGRVKFEVGNVLNLQFDDNSFDRVITERLLINLSTWEDQKIAIRKIHDILKPKGLFLMMEATKQGVERLNQVRERMGMKPIPATTKQNWWLQRFDEEELEKYLGRYFNIVKVQRFGLYYFVSRVVHPLLVYPEEPRFDAKINEIARDVALKIEPNFLDLGHSALFVLEKKVS